MRQSLICLATLAAIAIFPAESSAKLVLITRGDSFSHLGEIKTKNPAANGKALPANFAVGYKYSQFGIFWLDLWRYDGAYCVYHDKDYKPISKSEAATLMGVSESSFGEPFFYKYPPGLIILGLIIVGVIVSLVAQQKRKQKVMAIVDDPRYETALAIFQARVLENMVTKKMAEEKNEPAPKEELDAWEGAISHLVSEGIDRAEAEEQFGKVLAYAAEKSSEPQNN